MLILLIACTGAADDQLVEPIGIPALGAGSGSLEALRVEVVADAQDGLNTPRDLAFNPDRPGELWIVNRSDDSTTILFDAGTPDQVSQHDVDPYAQHFMEEVSSIAFGAPGTFGTCHESRNTYNGRSAPNNFMGPTLWSSDLDVYAQTNPQAVRFLGFDLGSHLDMLHESPDCMGMAWDHDNVYWVFDGHNQALARYDFQDDHGAGYDDHSDGIIAKYVVGQVQRVEDVPSHLVLDHVTGLLYVADTANGRVVVLDTETGTRGRALRVTEAGVDHYEVDDAVLTTLVEGADVGLGQPSGLALADGVLYVTDHSNGNVFAFDLDGTLIDWAATGRPGIMGIEVVSEREIWFVDAATDQVVRVVAD